MHFSLRYDPVFTTYDPRRGIRASQTLASSRVNDDIIRRRRVLRTVDRRLSKGNYKAALSLMNQLRGKPGGLIGYGAAKQVSKRISSLEELNLTETETSSLQALLDSILDSIKRGIQRGLVLQVSFGGGVGSLILDTIGGHTIGQKNHNRVIQHEAGHFLIAYLLGILPRGFTLPSLEALKQEDSLNVQAGTAFVEFEFLFNSGNVSATMLNSFSCVALAGVATEYLLYGYAEGGLSDINTLDGLLKRLGFTQKKADSQVRWAVLNTILILRRHEKARVKLAQAMSEGKSVGSCIDIIENTIDDSDL